MHSESKKLPKLIVLLGPTASGKTLLSLRIAKKIGAEIIGADSRQIYKKMTIGTAKPAGEWRRTGLRKTYYVDDIPHHLIDIIDPGKTFNVAEFRDKAIKYAKMAHKAGRIPMLVGGTGLYISSVVDNFTIPRIEPNKKLRKSLEEKTLEELTSLLEKMDPEAVRTIDTKNKRRLIRALEVCILTGDSFSKQKQKGEPLFDILQVGIETPREELYARIDARVDSMMEQGLLTEVENLLKQKYAWHLPSMSGVGYRQFRGYFEGTSTLEECVALLKRDTRHFARRQMTWFRRDDRITWCTSYEQVEQLVEEFLSE
jgi:tRNA dimethylallyltransferase